MELVSLSRKKFRESIEFPYNTVKEAEAALRQLREDKAFLYQTVETLVQEWKSIYPRGNRLKNGLPFYLARLQERSNTVLRWRGSGKEGPLAQKRFELTPTILEGISAPEIKLILNFDAKKNDLNYRVSTTKYDVERLDAYIQRIKSVRQLKKLIYTQQFRDSAT